MNTLVLYFILANLGLAAFYLFFRLLLQKDTFFAGKRLALLVGIVLALTYPLLDLSSWIQRSDSLVAYADVLRTRLPEIPANTAALASVVVSENGEEHTDAVVVGNAIEPANAVVSADGIVPAVEATPTKKLAPTPVTTSVTKRVNKTLSFTVFDYLLLIYLLTTAFLFFRITRQLIRIQKIRKHAERRKLHGQWVYVLKGCLSPFSFFNSVFMDPDVYSDKNQLEIIEHEKAHIKQGHSYDVVFSELVCALFWINPFAWLLKRSLRENLEFLADRDVIKKGVDPKTYQYKLLQLSCHRSDANLANHFNVSQLKKRIVMMNKKRTSWKGLGKYALYLPLFAALLLTAYAWGQQHETEAKALVEKATADSKVVTAITTTIDNAKALAQNTSIEKLKARINEVADAQKANQPNAVDHLEPQTIMKISGVTYRVIDDNNLELASYKGGAYMSIHFLTASPFNIASIGQHAFTENLRTVELPSTINVIDNQAFINCSLLTSIKLPNSLKKIGSEAFRGCSRLDSITIPASVTSIGEKAFHDCTGLKQLTVDPNNTHYASVDGVIVNKSKSMLIAYPNNTTSRYTIPSFVKSIGIRAFIDCTGLTSIMIPSTVKSILPGAFMGCTGLTSVTIPSSVTEIEVETFKGCTGLTSITIPSSVTNISSFAFSGCTALTSVTIPATTVSISDEAFQGCTALKQLIVDPKNPVYDSFEGKLVKKNKPSSTGKPSTLSFQANGFNYRTTSANSVELAPGGAYSGDIVIPSTVDYSGNSYQVTSIGNGALSNQRLTSVSIPASVSKITGGFTGSPETIHITVDEKNPYLISIDDVVFDKNKTTLFTCKGKKTQYVIPSTVTKIEMYAFVGCKSLTSLVIPSSVITIAPGVFQACTGLTAVEIPASVTLINPGTFQNCIGLTSVIIPASVTSISMNAFATCTGLTSITIPSSVKRIYSNAFKGCSGLKSISLPSSISTIESGTFQGCTGLTSITIPSSVTSIDSSAFTLCSNLATVTIAEKVSKISKDAFTGCTALKQFNVDGQNPNYSSLDGVLFNKDKRTLITFPIGKTTPYIIPSSVTTIEKNAFRNCKSLTSIAIPYSVTSIGEGAFKDCPIEEYRVDGKNQSFSSVDGVLFNKDRTTLIACPVTKSSQYTVPSTVTALGNNAFYGCKGLTSITLPSSVKTIGTDAFTNCRGLTSLVLPSSVTSIGSWAFNSCMNLSSITIPSSVTSIGTQAFFSCFFLKEIHCHIKQPLVTQNIFSNADIRNIKLYVPKGSKELYANAPEWGGFTTILEE